MPYGKADKCFAALTAVACVMLGIVCFLATISIVLAIWRAGFVMVLLWGLVFTAFFYASRAVYRVIIKNEWI